MRGEIEVILNHNVLMDGIQNIVGTIIAEYI
jgi:hypothetical protein